MDNLLAGGEGMRVEGDIGLLNDDGLEFGVWSMVIWDGEGFACD